MCPTVDAENVLQQLKADRLTSFSREGHSALTYLLLHIAGVILVEKGKVLAADEKRDLVFLIKNHGNWTIADKSQIPQWSYSLKSIWKFDHELKMFVWKKTKILGQIQILLQWYRAHNLPDSLLGDYRLSIAEGLMRGRNSHWR